MTLEANRQIQEVSPAQPPSRKSNIINIAFDIFQSKGKNVVLDEKILDEAIEMGTVDSTVEELIRELTKQLAEQADMDALVKKRSQEQIMQALSAYAKKLGVSVSTLYLQLMNSGGTYNYALMESFARSLKKPDIMVKPTPLRSRYGGKITRDYTTGNVSKKVPKVRPKRYNSWRYASVSMYRNVVRRMARASYHLRKYYPKIGHSWMEGQGSE